MDTTFVRRERIAPLPPPLATRGMLGFARQRLFGSVLNTALTLLSLLLLFVVLPPLLRFLIIDAVWDGASRVDCLPETQGRPVGACWPFVAAKFRQFMYGFYPEAEQWRINVTYALGVILLVPLLSAVPLALSDTAVLAGRINPSETQVTLPNAIKWGGWINGFPPAQR